MKFGDPGVTTDDGQISQLIGSREIFFCSAMTGIGLPAPLHVSLLSKTPSLYLCSRHSTCVAICFSLIDCGWSRCEVFVGALTTLIFSFSPPGVDIGTMSEPGQDFHGNLSIGFIGCGMMASAIMVSNGRCGLKRNRNVFDLTLYSLVAYKHSLFLAHVQLSAIGWSYCQVGSLSPKQDCLF